jgi:uncharacterized protein YbbC (DUF1343 family)
MKTGLEVLLASPSLIAGRRFGLIVNQTAVDRKLRHLVPLLGKRKGVVIQRIFTPEHGLWGTEQDQVAVVPAGGKEAKIPVISLYGQDEESLSPRSEMLQDLDALIFDIQDIGTRYYTFVYTMAFCMAAAARMGVEMLVLDRPNPINGVTVEGNILEERFRSLVGRYPIPVRHGMTAGELARLFNAEFGIGCRLEVVATTGWKRARFMDETGLPWVLPSPNMPTIDTALVYPGMCLIEGTHLSEGRGTTKPFEMVGAPYIEPEKLARALAAEKLPGVLFRPTYFKPTFHKWAGTVCGGVQLHVARRNAFKPYLTGIAVVRAVKHLWPDRFEYRKEPYEFVSDRLAFDLLTGTDRIREKIDAGVPIGEIEKDWLPALEQFKKVREKYLLYP